MAKGSTWRVKDGGPIGDGFNLGRVKVLTVIFTGWIFFKTLLTGRFSPRENP